MTWHHAPITSRISRYARDGAAVYAWERCPGTAAECAHYRYVFRTEAAARGVVGRMLADPFPGGVLLSLARAAGVEPDRLA